VSLIAPIAAPLVVPRLAPIPVYLPAWQPHLLSGPSGVGKTAFTAWLCHRFLSELDIFGKPVTRPPWIGLITTDREQDDTLKWYVKAGVADAIQVYSAIDDFAGFDFFKLRSPQHALTQLRKILELLQAPPNGLLLLDPMSWVAGGDLNRYDRVMPAMGALSQLCLQRQLTIIGLAHTGKQKADPAQTYKRAQDKILGSMALLGSSGTQMALEGPDQTGIEGEYRFSWTPHHAPAEEYLLCRSENGLFVPREAPAQETYSDEHGRLLTMIALLPDGEPTTTATWLLEAEKLGIAKTTFYRYIDRAIELGLIEKAGHGKYRKVRAN
jgi:hypothetical protein